MDTVIQSRSKTVVIGAEQPFCIIGERINPTGRKAFQAQLQQGDLSQLEIDVAEQVANADMLDVNVGDPLAMPVGAEPRAVTLFCETVRLIRDELGVNMTCGASNTSFGLPGRHTLGAAFLAVAQSHGLTSAIMDARNQEVVEAVRATDFLLGHDEWGARWIARHRAKQAAAATA